MLVSYVYPVKPEHASFRLRMAMIGDELEKLGHEVTIGPLPLRGCDVAVFAKHFIKDSPRLAQLAKRDGARVVYDVCDDHFGNPERGPHYRAMCDAADVVTTCSPAMSRRVNEETGKLAISITDPYELPLFEPQVTTESRLLWFGHPINLKALFDAMPSMGNRQLMVVSKPIDPRIVPYSRENLIDAFTKTDVVVLPGPKPATSPNRMVESIRQGKYVIAGEGCAAYEGYGMWTGDIAEGLAWFEENREEACERVKAAQAIVEEKHAPAVVAQEWLQVFATPDGR